MIFDIKNTVNYKGDRYQWSCRLHSSVLAIGAVEVRLKTINKLKSKIDIPYRRVKQIKGELQYLDLIFYG